MDGAFSLALGSESAILSFLVLLAVAVRLYSLSLPNEVVFDESHVGDYVSHYITGNYTVDAHPPLGKLLIAMV
ncbi:hypothetical protein HK096_003895, partial [Nowakowskiella sp. JEL0078]